MMTNNIADRFIAARRVSTPLIAVRTLDPASAIQTLIASGNGAPKIQWDAASGFTALDEAGRLALDSALGGQDPSSVTSPADALIIARTFAAESILFAVNLHRYVQAGSGNDSLAAVVVQAIWNLRDDFKADRRTLVILCPEITLPPELLQDVQVIDDDLPSPGALSAIVAEIFEAADLTAPAADVLAKAADVLCGLSAFAAEQAAAQSLTKAGIDFDTLWERKRRLVEQAPGVSVYSGDDNFESVGGCSNVKTFLSRLIAGKRPPKCIVFIDEIEKGLAGSSGGGDSSGVSQAIHGGLLSFMEDKKARGVIFVGPPGAAKSAIAKAIGNEAGIPTIQLDLSGLKGSLVGQSEANLRGALKVVEAIGGTDTFFVATCNRVSELSPEIKRRFSYGTWFFDLPDAEERAAIWPIHIAASGVDAIDVPTDLELSGAEIRNACDLAFSLDITLREAAGYLVPVAVSGADSIAALRQQASGKFLSAGAAGVYRLPDITSRKARALAV